MTVTKATLVESIRGRLDIPKAKAGDILNAFFEIMKERLEEGESILVTGFGKFCVRERKDGRGRNPITVGNPTPDCRRIVTFRCSSVLRDKLNGKREI